MKKRTIRNNNVSLLGMGCMRFPVHPETNQIDLELTEKMIDFAYQSGVNYFDTAYPYHAGKSEIVIGNLLKKYPRESFFLANKLPIWECKNLEDAKRIFEEQLKKCQVDYFDFYLCHAMNLDRFYVYKEWDVFNYLLELKKQGKIRNLGFSFHDAARHLKVIAEELDWDFAQIQLNYLDYEMQDAKLQYEILTNRDIPVVVMEPVRGGVLANICQEAENVFRKIHPEWSNASWALRYVADFSNVKVILSGMSSISQLEDNINTLSHDISLSSIEYQAIEQAKKIILGNDFIPCTGCRYCMPCPFGVDIPTCFKMFNMFGIHKDIDRFHQQMLQMDDTKKPSNCRKCGKCMKECPQNILIPTQLHKISTF